MFKKITLSLIPALLPAVALAQLVPPVVPTPVGGQLGSAIQQVINVAAGLVIAASVIFLIYGAVLYLISEIGDTRDKAKNVIIYSIVAVAVALLASVIISFVVRILGQFPGGGA